MGTVVDVYPEKVAAWMEDDDTVVIDVREAGELIQGRIAGARHLPLSSFDPAELGVDRAEKVVFFCAHGIRSRQVGQWLIDHGYLDAAYSVAGGIVAWAAARLPLQTCAPCYPQVPRTRVPFGAGADR